MKATAGEVYTVYNQYLKRYTACQVAYIAPPDSVSKQPWAVILSLDWVGDAPLTAEELPHLRPLYTVRCSIIQPGQQSLFDNEHTVYETVKVGEADGVLGTSTDEHGKNVYTLSWEYQGITHTVMGNIPYDEIMKIAEGIR